MVEISLYYRSGWNKALLHYNSNGERSECSGKNASEWFYKEFTPVSGIRGWHVVTLGMNMSLEFVICNGSKTEWDNPPQFVGSSNFQNSRNYRVDLDDENKENQLRFCLMEGRITLIPKIAPMVLVTDLDGTLLGHNEYLRRFNDIWIREHLFNGSKLIYSTGRNLKDFLVASREHGLLRPDFAICGVGTEIYEFPEGPMSEKAYSNHLELVLGCDKKTDRLPSQRRQSDRAVNAESVEDECETGSKDPGFPEWCPDRLFARPLESWFRKVKETFDREEVVKDIKETLNRNNLDHHINGDNFHDPFRLSVSVRTRDANEAFDAIQASKKKYKYAISGHGEWRYLDILPEMGGKRLSIIFIYEEVLGAEIPLSKFLVCGDSGNDAHMFTINTSKNCCVANAQQDLKDFLTNGKISHRVSKRARELGTVFLNENKRGEERWDSESHLSLSPQSELLRRIMNIQGLCPPNEVSSSMRLGPVNVLLMPTYFVLNHILTCFVQVFVSTFPNAGGIIQALIHYDFVSDKEQML